MTRPDETDAAPAPGQRDLGCGGVESPERIEKGPGCYRRDLIPILVFFRREMDESASLLRDLAETLSRALCSLGMTDDLGVLRSSLFTATTALQNEDRVQQRLGDLGAALSVLEQTLAKPPPASITDIDRAVFECLRMEEMREAFAIGVDMVDVFPPSCSPSKVPAVGDIDLF